MSAAVLSVTADNAGVQYCEVDAGDGLDSLEGLDAYLADLNSRLRVGKAFVTDLQLGDTEMPTGVVIGGWPIAEPCCEGSPSPHSDWAGCAGERQRRWECGLCGGVVRPDQWAMIPLSPLGAPEGIPWKVPAAGRAAHEADTALVKRLAHRAAVDRRAVEEMAAALAAGGIEQVGNPYIEFGSSPSRMDAEELGTPIALVRYGSSSDGRGQVTLGCWMADVAGWTPDRRQFPQAWCAVAHVEIDPSDAVRLMGPLRGDRVWAEARTGRLTARTLRRAWAAEPSAAPSWLCDDAAVEQLQRAVDANATKRAVRGIEGL